MDKKLYDTIKINDLKEMLNKTRELYDIRPYEYKGGTGK